jgi:hypothetical protein
MIKCDLKEMLVKCGCQYTSFKWVNHDKKAVFFEVPKNGSTSIKKILFQNKFVMLEDSELDISKYYKFAVIRNPWDRTVSNWKMFCSNTGKQMHHNQLNALFESNPNKYTFEQFLNLMKIKNNHHWEQQVEFLKDFSQKYIYMDFYIRFENFYNDFKKVKNELNLTGALLNINKTDHNFYQEYFNHIGSNYPNKKLVRFVRDKYADDIKRFNYRF